MAAPVTLVDQFGVPIAGVGASSLTIQGAGAAGVAAVGSPVGIGGVYNVTQPTLTTGWRGDVQLGVRGSMRTELYGAGLTTGVVAYGPSGDAVVPGTIPGLGVNAVGFVFNGTNFDRARGDVNGQWVTNPSNYETVAASATAQTLGATGATGDYIHGILVIPATTTPGLVTLLDNATSIPVFVGGTVDVKPFFIQLGMKSISGAWKITTGASVSCIGIGRFT